MQRRISCRSESSRRRFRQENGRQKDGTVEADPQEANKGNEGSEFPLSLFFIKNVLVIIGDIQVI